MSLTTRQQDTLEAIRYLLGELGYSPSLREIAIRLGVHLTMARRHVLALEDAGMITRAEGNPRSIRLTPLAGK